MNFPIYAAFTFTVALLVATAYFLIGGLPLLTLRHDTPLDARFIRGFFTVYYRAAFWTASGACLSYALWGRYTFALGAGAVAITTILLRRFLLEAMRQLGDKIETSPDSCIARFRQVHAAALSVNLIQLIVIVWGVLQLSRQISLAGV